MSDQSNDLPVVVCVLKSGTWRPRPDYSVSYGPAHVQWLRDQFLARVTQPHRFVCMTDLQIPGVETRPLTDDLPGWWSKLEIFREFRSAAYVDLDTVIVGDVSRYLFEKHRFTVSAGIHVLRNGAINSSLMCWDGDYRWIYEEFIARKDEVMAEYTNGDRWGDQGFIRDVAAGRIAFQRFQRRYPGAVLNYQRDLLGKIPAFGSGRAARRVIGQVRVAYDWMTTPRIVFFNGTKKPWDVREPWIPELTACVA
jgi:hypothetical protein